MFSLKKRVDDWAFGDGGAGALRCHVFKNLSELLKVGDLAADIGEMFQGHRADIGAGPVTAFDKGQQPAHLV
jgi:hypothetical protein